MEAKPQRSGKNKQQALAFSLELSNLGYKSIAENVSTNSKSQRHPPPQSNLNKPERSSNEITLSF